MGDVAIRVENLSKQYRIGGPQARYKTLRESLVGAAQAPIRRAGRLLRGEAATDEQETIWALKDVSFEVKHGEVLGIIGRNGAGKSTLLKILSRITAPTEGTVDLYGRVGSLLEVGTGFHPELTGRENIHLNGAILGMKRAEIERKFDEIVAFAELEKFLDTPVKHYSSGMYVRLAFAVAAHLDPEILLVDEVLAVGDAAFQKKCLGKMGEVAGEGRTVLFVSHNMGGIRGLCSRAMCVDSGQIVRDGKAEQAITYYFTALFEGEYEDIASGANIEGPIEVNKVILRDSDGKPSREFTAGERLTVEIHYYAHRRIDEPNFWIAVAGQHGPLFGAGTVFDGHVPDVIEGKGILSCTFKQLPLMPQTYTVRFDVRSRDWNTMLVPNQEVAFFRVIDRLRDIGFTGESADRLSSIAAPVMVPYEWHLPDGRSIPVERPVWTKAKHELANASKPDSDSKAI